MTREETTQKLAIWGASGHALVVADIFRLMGGYDIIGFIDDINPSRKGSFFCGSEIIGGKEQLDILKRNGVRNIFFGFGNCQARLRLAELVLKTGFLMPKAIHPSAIIAHDASIGGGTAVVAGAVINPGVRIGRNVIVNTSASIDHECIIEDGVHISPGVHVAGQVVVKRGAWIGIGATVIEKLQIGEGAIIGAGSVVLSDISPNVVAYGSPAKPIRER